jgi:hypothetical protein
MNSVGQIEKFLSRIAINEPPSLILYFHLFPYFFLG